MDSGSSFTDNIDAMVSFGESLVQPLYDFVDTTFAPVTGPFQNVFKQVDAQLEPVSAAAGLDLDQLRVVACLLLSTPLAFVFARLTPLPPTFKHIFSLSIGLLFSFYTIGAQTYHGFVSSLIAYLMVAIFNRHGFAHKLVFVFAMTYMSLGHIYRMYVDYLGWHLDFTGPQMVITIKLTTFAFNCYDGTRRKEDLKKYYLDRRIIQLPSLLEYFGWIYFFPGYLIGPSFDFTHYKKYCDSKEPYFPSTVTATLKSLVLTLLCLIFIGLKGFFPVVEYMKSPEYLEMNFFYRFGYMWIGTSLKRFDYYFAWGLAETAFIACGLGYDEPVDEKDPKKGHKWNKVACYQLLDVELAPNIRSTIQYWNMRTQQWLENYVYKRIPSSGKGDLKPLIITNFMSAFWHGFYPGYYLAFGTASLYVFLARDLRRVLRPYFVTKLPNGKEKFSPYKRIYDVAGWLVTMTSMSYTFCAFMVLDFHATWAIWTNFYFLGHIIPFIVWVLIQIFAPKPQRKMDAKEKPKTNLKPKSE